MSFRKRWKPNKAQREAYAKKMQEAEEKYTFISSPYPIRVGCMVEWVDKSTCSVYKGEVRISTYGSDNQHTFTIDTDRGTKCVKGRNLYSRLLRHSPGEIAKDVEHPLNNRGKDY